MPRLADQSSTPCSMRTKARVLRQSKCDIVEIAQNAEHPAMLARRLYSAIPEFRWNWGYPARRPGLERGSARKHGPCPRATGHQQTLNHELLLPARPKRGICSTLPRFSSAHIPRPGSAIRSKENRHGVEHSGSTMPCTTAPNRARLGVQPRSGRPASCSSLKPSIRRYAPPLSSPHPLAGCFHSRLFLCEWPRATLGLCYILNTL